MPASERGLAMVMPGPGEALRVEERRVVSPGAGEVLVRVHAVSLNYHDLVNLAGRIEGPWPRVPMTDGAGEVVAVGPGVAGVAPGERVVSTFYPAWLDGPPTREGKREVPGDLSDGWLQQYQVVHAATVVSAPPHLSDLEAATLPCAATTAWSALRSGGVRPGDVVVAQGTGGVSLWALQLAKAQGATVILTSSSDAKLRIGGDLGADHLINYRTTPEWEREVRAVTGGRGADLVVDVGGPGTLGRSVRCVRTGGMVAIVGVLGGVGMAEIPVSVAMTRNVRLEGITVGSVRDHRELCRAVAAAGLHPHISHRFGWEELAVAVRVMQANEHVGKVALTVP